MTTGSTHPSEEKIKETQADLDNMVTALNSASITTPSVAQKVPTTTIWQCNNSHFETQ